MILNQFAGGGPGNLDGVTARPDTVLQGFSFVDRDGNLRTGAIPEVKTSVNYNPANGNVQGAPGYYPNGPTGTTQQAGAPYVDSCTFDRQNKRVTVRARTAQAGWQGQPVGNVQTFAIPVDTFENYVYKYNVKNNGRRGSIEITTGSGEAPTVNGVSVPRSATIPLGAEDAIYSSIGKFELNAPLGGGDLSVNYYRISLGDAVQLSRAPLRDIC